MACEIVDVLLMCHVVTEKAYFAAGIIILKIFAKIGMFGYLLLLFFFIGRKRQEKHLLKIKSVTFARTAPLFLRPCSRFVHDPTYKNNDTGTVTHKL